jgi:hypothetical protein
MEMGYRHTRFSGRQARPEPSWPTVIATTLRLWLERHPIPGRLLARRLFEVIAILLASAVAAGAAWLALGFASPFSSAPSAVPRQASPGSVSFGGAAAGALGASIATRAKAAQWIDSQVAPSAIVACDPEMCAALQAGGLPAARLLMLGTAAADPLGSDVVVATPALRSQFGSRLASVYAPAVIARFGSGAAGIDVRAIAPLGAAAYESALRADRLARIAAGRELLHNTHIATSRAAAAALRSGDVDSRLLLTLAALAAQQPLRILAFDDRSPGASSAPLRGAELAPDRPGKRPGARLRSMLSFVNAQRAPFLPLRASIDRAISISFEYAAPSPLGELGRP